MSTPCVLLGTSLFSLISFLLIKKKKKISYRGVKTVGLCLAEK